MSSNSSSDWEQRNDSEGNTDWVHETQKIESTDGWSHTWNSEGEHKWEHESGQIVDDEGNVTWKQ